MPPIPEHLERGERRAVDLPTFTELLTAATERVAPTGRTVSHSAVATLDLADEVLVELIGTKP